MGDITEIIGQIERGEPKAVERLLPLVYGELKRLAAEKLAAERTDHTLQPTALVHEAYIRLVDTQNVPTWDGLGHFFIAAAEAMRRILIESARRKGAAKRGGDRRRLQADVLEDVESPTVNLDRVLDIDATLTRFAERDPKAAELVKLRLYAGFSVTEAGEMLGLPRTTAYKCWDYACVWFRAHGEGA